MGLYEKIRHIEIKWDQKILKVESDAKDCKMDTLELQKKVMSLEKSNRRDMRVMLEKERKNDSNLDAVIKDTKTYTDHVEDVSKKCGGMLNVLFSGKSNCELDETISYLEDSFDMASEDYVTVKRNAKRKEFIKFNVKTGLAAGGIWAIAQAFGDKLPRSVRLLTGPAISGVTNASYLYLDNKYTKESMGALKKRAEYVDSQVKKIYDKNVRRFYGEKV